MSPDMMNIRIGVMTELYQMTKNMNPSQARRMYESGMKRRAIRSLILLAFELAVGSGLIFGPRILLATLKIVKLPSEVIDLTVALKMS